MTLRVRWLLIAVSIAIPWELAARLLADWHVVAAPSSMVVYAVSNAGTLGRAMMATSSAALAGFVAGNVTAMALGCIAILLPRIAPIVSICALVGFCLPFVATGPLLRILFGPGAGPQASLAALAVYYPTYLCLLVGLRAVPGNWLDLSRSYGRNNVSMLLHIRAPAALPYLFAGLRIGAPAALLGAMVGEFTGAEGGLGVLAVRAMGALDVTATWTIALLAAALSIAAHAVVSRAGRKLGFGAPPLLVAGQRGGPGTTPLAMLGQALAAFALIALVWTVSMDWAGLSPYFAKRPADVLAFLSDGPEAAGRRAILAAALGQTLVLAIGGYLAGVALGVGLAAVCASFRRVAGAALPLAIAARSIPIVTTAPILVLALGRGVVGTLVIIAVMTFFPVFIACRQGMDQLSGQASDIFRSYATGRWNWLVHGRLPAMLPAFFASARMSVPAAVLAATTVEWLATGRGVGGLMAVTASTSAYGMLWSAMVALCLIVTGLYWLVEWLERHMLRIYAAEQLAA